MDALLELKNKFATLNEVLPGMLREVFLDIASVVEEANIDQLDRGERVDGSSLPNYSPNSVRFFGKTPGPMNLHNLGNYWRGIRLQVYADGVELVGLDIKTEMLQLRYGDTIGLQEGSKERIETDHVKPEIEPRVKDYLNG